EFVDHLRHQRKLLSRSNGAADAHGVVVCRLLPGCDVFESFGEVEFLEALKEHDLETRPGKFEHLFRRQTGGRFNKVAVQGCIVPPVGGNGAEFPWHKKRTKRPVRPWALVPWPIQAPRGLRVISALGS